MGMHLRRADADDLTALLVIESASYPEPWDEATFRSFLSDPSTVCLVLVDEPGIIGYALGLTSLGMSQLLSIAVFPARRGSGLATQLLDALVVECRARGASYMRLEVRSANRSARRLYDAYGFSMIGLRPRYYGDDDALIMSLNL